MNYNVKTVEEYLEAIPSERKPYLQKMRELITTNLPEGFKETISYGMMGYVVPHELYPAGYHVDPDLPLPFINIASQKNFIALYHSGIYADPDLNKWFQTQYKKNVSTKLDMGKSCIRFNNPKTIPFELIAELAKKMTVQEWIAIYERNLKR